MGNNDLSISNLLPLLNEIEGELREAVRVTEKKKI